VTSFRDQIGSSRRNGQPLLAFNIVDLPSALGVLDAARSAVRPVILQVSARTVRFYGTDVVAASLKSAVRAAGVCGFVHLDHCQDDDLIGASLEAGFDGVMVDGSHLPFEANVAWTRRWVEQARATDAVVEGEVTPIVGAEDGIMGADAAAPPEPQEYETFSVGTGVDFLGADIGTAHGLYAVAPTIHFDFLAAVVRPDLPGFVVHGASGLDEGRLRRLARLGVAKLNFSTDLKTAWFRGITDSTPAGLAEPLKALEGARAAVAAMAKAKWHCMEDA
jgi:tagatose 1,6-diphosphate aldolase GatY/KbaY